MNRAWLPALSLATVLVGVPGPASARGPKAAAEVDMPDRYAGKAGGGPVSRSPWWRSFSDASLARMVETGLEANNDVKAATSRIEEADAVVEQQLSPLLPQVTWDTNATMAPTDSLGFQFGGIGGGMGPPPPTLYYTGSSVVNAGVEIDLAGKQILTRRASKKDLEAAADDRDLQRRLVVRQITEAYYDVVTAKAQLAVIKEQIKTNEEVLELTNFRFRNAQATAVEVLQQEQQLAATRTLEPPAETQLRVFQQRLAILMGEAPGTTYPTPDQLPDLPPLPGIGTPDDLLDNRPELRAARERLGAADDRRKSANRAFAPTLRVSGQGGVQFFNLTEFDSQWFWNAGVTLSVPLYTGGRTLAQSRQARASQNTAIHQLNQSTLTAVQEVEEALVREEVQHKAVEAYEAQLAAAQKAFEESRARYASGAGDYLTMLSALGAAQAAEINVINAQRQLIGARIQLHDALGDPWRGNISRAEGPAPAPAPQGDQ